MSADVETIVVGAGVVGLAVARALALAGHETMVLEQHELIGSETSSRNSEVIHAGIYYPPGSLRATLCVRGKELLYAFCAENNVPHARCGKLLVATQESQLPKLAAIRETAARNGVTDLEPLGGQCGPRAGAGARLRCRAAVALDRHHRQPRLHAGAGGPHRGQRRLGGAALSGRARRARRRRPVPPDHRRREPRRHHLQAPRDLGRAARLQARAARSPTADGYRPPETYYAKGQYYALSGRSPFKRHIYPHARRRLARPARHRRHRRALQVRPRHRLDPRHRLRLRAREARASSSTSSAAIIRASRWSACTPTTRASAPSSTAKASRCPTSPSTGPRSTGRTGLVALYGIESPGLTASLAIGEVVAGLLARRR